MRFVLALSLLAVAGCSHTVQFDYDALRGGMSAAEARKLPPDKSLTCMVPTSGQGLSKCDVDVTELDGIKATRVTYVFNNDKLMACTVEYSPGAYAQVSAMLDKRYSHDASNNADHGSWKVRDGVLISSASDLRHGNVYAYWLSTEEAAKAGVKL